ncbi:MAG: tRNA preQ1(34) S-adenosylmethionine ribosyltransferase-isomerase QueA [Treponema sp.]|jgi:S-adenosylmethionine:tRNA ribosyltransferase-isomerase|nr:tRNA preQ1(34) S-adenosylmethionine ribosyltransferase-isomerase QueA [Treponema sp.]
MKTSDFFFELPENLIAQYPPAERGKSRLMVLDRRKGTYEHRMAEEFPAVVAGRFGGPDRVLLVFNNSRVRKARLPGRSAATGAAAEFLLVNRVDSRTWRALVEKSKRKKSGSRYVFSGGMEAEIVDAQTAGSGHSESPGFRYLCFDAPIDDDWLDSYGHVPLPPYIARPDEVSDGERYQTVYADRNAASALGPGASVAAPTAGLHFTDRMLAELAAAGVETAFVTLHVGLGTFLPVRGENVEDHLMHEEVYSIGEDAAGKINAAKVGGKKIIAVGTTSVRTLESAWGSGTGTLGSSSDEIPGGGGIRAGEGTTSIFIYPGYRFRAVDGLFTNFHTPGSTLLMLVSAFAENPVSGCRTAPETGPSAGRSGRERILESYAEAIREGYRFFSYGDAMLIC